MNRTANKQKTEEKYKNRKSKYTIYEKQRRRKTRGP